MTHPPNHLLPLFALSAATVLLGCGAVEYGSTPPRPTANALRAFGSGPALEVEEEISIEIFYEELAAYGEWMDAPRVGRVFVPHDPDYRPYRNGRWVQRDDGLVWVSYDAIGWAVCHYGSWAVLDDQRWAWVPDTQWGPGWVEWRENPEYVGWSPRMAYVAPTVPPQTTWVFVQTTYLLSSYVSESFLAPAAAVNVYGRCPPMQARPDRAWIRSRGVRQARTGSLRLPSATAPGRPPRRVASGGRGAQRSPRARRAASGGRAEAADPRSDASGGYAIGGGGTYAARPGLVERPRLHETVVIGGRALRHRSVPRGSVRPHLTLTGPGAAQPHVPPLTVPPVTVPPRDLPPRTVRPVLRQPNLPHPAVRHARSAPDLQVRRAGPGPDLRGPGSRPPRVVRPMPSLPPSPNVRGPRPRVAPTPPPRAVRPQVAAPRVVAPRVTAPRVAAPRVTAPRVTAPRVIAPPPRVARPAPQPSAPRRPRSQRRPSRASIVAPARPRRAVGGGGLRVRR